VTVAATTSPLRALQLQELELLRELARRCEAASLRWYVLGGTLIGAARHGGFVPWDDDVDVGMPRPDYDRFEALSATEIDPRFGWQSAATEAAWPFAYGKLLLAGSDIVDPSTAHLPIRRGAFIDIFPLDGAPAPGPGRWVHRLGLKLAVTALGSRLRRRGPRSVAALPLRLVPRGLSLAVLAALARRHPFDASPFAVNAGGAWGYTRECQPIATFEPAARLAFEGLEVLAPARWYSYLAGIYGDWERLPPDADRMPRHGLVPTEAEP
jgi:lipopolysaccharide cholinephosphotransferase